VRPPVLTHPTIEWSDRPFCPAPATSCSFVPSDKRTEPLIWFDFAGPLPNKFKIEQQGGLYVVDFIGRRTVDRGHYGHMGVFDGEVIVDRMISMKEIEAPPKPAKADVRSMIQWCQATPECRSDGKTPKALNDELKK